MERNLILQSILFLGLVCHLGWTYDIVIRPNVLTADCPNGQVFWTQCKKCFCKENVNNSPHWPYPYCRKDKCENWQCPNPPVYKLECEGRCECNATSSITICDKYCEKQLQNPNKPKVQPPQLGNLHQHDKLQQHDQLHQYDHLLQHDADPEFNFDELPSFWSTL